MSLSFVSKTIQTATESGDFEEKPIENPTETGVSRNAGASSGLFEQLRQNSDKKEEEAEEFQRSIMRGTLTLNEEDAAHLDFLAKKRERERSAVENSTELALADFRAAQSERVVKKEPMKSNAVFKSEHISPVSTTGPTILVKKRKRVDEGRNAEVASTVHDSSTKNDITDLLAGYGSSSDDD